jgi:hypothetical protein
LLLCCYFCYCSPRLSDGPAARIKSASSSPHALFALYVEAKGGAADSIVGCRLELGRVLPHIKRQVLRGVSALHAAIEAKLRAIDDLVQTATSRRLPAPGAGAGGQAARAAAATEDVLDSIAEDEDPFEESPPGSPSPPPPAIASPPAPVPAPESVAVVAASSGSSGSGGGGGELLDRDTVKRICELLDDMDLDIDALKEQVPTHLHPLAHPLAHWHSLTLTHTH